MITCCATSRRRLSVTIDNIRTFSANTVYTLETGRKASLCRAFLICLLYFFRQGMYIMFILQCHVCKNKLLNLHTKGETLDILVELTITRFPLSFISHFSVWLVEVSWRSRYSVWLYLIGWGLLGVVLVGYIWLVEACWEVVLVVIFD